MGASLRNSYKLLLFIFFIILNCHNIVLSQCFEQKAIDIFNESYNLGTFKKNKRHFFYLKTDSNIAYVDYYYTFYRFYKDSALYSIYNYVKADYSKRKDSLYYLKTECDVVIPKSMKRKKTFQDSFGTIIYKYGYILDKYIVVISATNEKSGEGILSYYIFKENEDLLFNGSLSFIY